MIVLTVSSQVISDKSVEVIDFQRFKGLPDDGAVEALVKEVGVVYVTALTRDGCSGCMEQKPLFRDLSERMNSDLCGLVHFPNVHVSYSEDDRLKSWESTRGVRP